jgi:hypothetical protein
MNKEQLLDEAFKKMADSIELSDELDNPNKPLPEIPRSAQKIWADAALGEKE